MTGVSATPIASIAARAFPCRPFELTVIGGVAEEIEARFMFNQLLTKARFGTIAQNTAALTIRSPLRFEKRYVDRF